MKKLIKKILLAGALGFSSCALPYLHAETIQSLVFSDTPISQVLYIMEELTGKTIIQDSSIPDITINLQIKKETEKADAIRAIESALAINKVAIVELGEGMLKAVSAEKISAQSPRMIDKSLLNEPPSEQICSKIFYLEYIPAEDFSKIISNILSKETSSLSVFTTSNSVMVIDSVSNLQRIELILSKVDVPKQTRIQSKVFRIKYGDANNITNLLHNVISKQESTKTEKQTQLHSKDEKSFEFSKNITIECDERSNSIVVCGTHQDIEYIQNIIERIDVLLDQVRIEVILAQVTLDQGQSSGLSSFDISYNSGDSKKVASGEHEIKFGLEGEGYPGGASPFGISGTLRDFSLSTVFNKAKSDSHVKILSAPTIVTTHNHEAFVRIAESMPVVTSDLTDSNGGSTAVRSNIEYKNIGLELKVKPLIGINGIVQLEISQTVEKRKSDIKINGNAMPITSRREATSFVSVADGDVVVLAGLQEKESSKNKGKLWLLGDIPVLGKALFSPKSRSETRSEMIVFIKPTIVTNPIENERYFEQSMDGFELEEDIRNYHETGKFLPSDPFPKCTLSDPTEPIKKPKSKTTPRVCHCQQCQRLREQQEQRENERYGHDWDQYDSRSKHRRQQIHDPNYCSENEQRTPQPRHYSYR